MKKIPDVQILHRKHVEISLKRDAWAKKGLEYEKAGEIGKARVALRKAEYWDFQRRELEASVRQPVRTYRLSPSALERRS